MIFGCKRYLLQNLRRFRIWKHFVKRLLCKFDTPSTYWGPFTEAEVIQAFVWIFMLRQHSAVTQDAVANVTEDS